MSDAEENRHDRSDSLPMTEVVSRVDELLELRYRSSDLGNLDDPLDEAIYILLSLQTREPVYRRVFARLKDAFPHCWSELLQADHDTLVQLVQPAGFQEQRASKIKQFVAAVAGEPRALGKNGKLSLEFLRGMNDREVLAYLESLPGMGPKSARCVMAFSLGRDRFAVDTHVRRILERLELVDAQPGKPRHEDYERLVPSRLRRRLHINLVHHGRAVCTSRKPKCHKCVLVSFCPGGQRAVARESSKPVAVELFAGAGGMGEGFRQAGYRLAAAIERDRNPAQTYRLNHPGTPVLEADIVELDESSIRQLAPGLPEVAVLLAGPPCQGYSAAGRRDPDDPANRLYRHVARFAKLLQPQLVVLENVGGLRRVRGVDFTSRIRTALLNVGYDVNGPEQLKASQFGVPQNRTRLFFLARRADLGPPPAPPAATHLPPGELDLLSVGKPKTQCLKDVLADLPQFGPGVEFEYGIHEGRPIFNASTMAHSRGVVTKIAGIKGGEGPISYRRLAGDIAQTLVAGHRALPVHPWLHRTISVREAARIQGFRDDYIFAGPRSNQPLQVANAVPPPVAEAIGLHLLDHLDASTTRDPASDLAPRPQV